MHIVERRTLADILVGHRKVFGGDTLYRICRGKSDDVIFRHLFFFDIPDDYLVFGLDYGRATVVAVLAFYCRQFLL